MLKRYMNGGMMEYPGGGLTPKQYDDGGPLTKAEARALADQYKETGELTEEMRGLLFGGLSESEMQILDDGMSSGKFDEKYVSQMLESAIRNNRPLEVSGDFKSEYLKDSEGDITADNLKGSYKLYGRDGEIKDDGRKNPIRRGDDGPYGIARNRLVKSDNLKWPFKPGDTRDFDSPGEPEPVLRREDPVDPVTPREPVVVRVDPERTPQRRPEPEPERIPRIDLPEVVITPERDPEVRRDRTRGIPMGDLLTMPSDYTGSGGADRAGGPFAQERLSKEQLFKALSAMQNGGGGFPFKKRRSRYRR